MEMRVFEARLPVLALLAITPGFPWWKSGIFGITVFLKNSCFFFFFLKNACFLEWLKAQRRRAEKVSRPSFGGHVVPLTPLALCPRQRLVADFVLGLTFPDFCTRYLTCWPDCKFIWLKHFKN